MQEADAIDIAGQRAQRRESSIVLRSVAMIYK